MKRTILLLLTVFAVTAAHAQQKVTLKQCQGDTVAYLRKTFDQGKSRFIGQPFSKVMDEWSSQLPVNFLVFSDTGIWPTKDEDKLLVTGVSMYYNTETETNLKGMRHEPYYGLTIVFAPPYYQKSDDLRKLRNEEGTALGPKLYEMLKDYIVKDISSFEMTL